MPPENLWLSHYYCWSDPKFHQATNPKKTFLSTSQKPVSTCNAWFHCLSPTFCYLQLAPGSFRIPHRHTRWWTWSVLATRDVSHGQVSWLGYPYWGISILKKWLLNMIIYIIIYSIIYIYYIMCILYIYIILYIIYILYIILYYIIYGDGFIKWIFLHKSPVRGGWS